MEQNTPKIWIFEPLNKKFLVLDGMGVHVPSCIRRRYATRSTDRIKALELQYLLFLGLYWE